MVDLRCRCEAVALLADSDHCVLTGLCHQALIDSEEFCPVEEAVKRSLAPSTHGVGGLDHDFSAQVQTYA